jgi:hypothetical protein
MTEPYLAEALIRLDADLRALRVEWAVVGGLAVSARAEPRTTRDIDAAIVVAGDEEAERIIRLLRDRGYVLDTVLEQTGVGRLSAARLLRQGDNQGILVDLLFASSGIEAEADVLEILPGLFTPVAKTGHLLALKVLALRPDRPQERPQDFADIRELLKIADEDEVERGRQALDLISQRGFNRDKDLEAELEEQLRQFREHLGDGWP